MPGRIDDAVPSLTPLVLGPPESMRAAVAGTPPTAEFLLTPVPARIGAYPPGCYIEDQTLVCPRSHVAFRLWLEMRVRNWDPNGDAIPPLGVAQGSVRRGFLGAEATPPAPGVDLQFPVIPCMNNAECNTILGETWARCASGRCAIAYQDRDRPDWMCPGEEDCAVRDCYDDRAQCFVVQTDPFMPDPGTTRYLGTVVLDVPAAAAGSYTLEWDIEETFLADSASPPMAIEVLRRVPAVLNFGSPVCPPVEAVSVPKNRALSLDVADCGAGGPCEPSAIRLKMIDLQNPNPPNAPQFPPPDFSAYELGSTCTDPGGCIRWVGIPASFPECEYATGEVAGTFKVARLQCTPFYHDWATEGVFHVMDGDIVPSSQYDVEFVPQHCQGSEPSCADVLGAVTMTTARWGDVAPRFNPPSTATQPDALDIVAARDKFSCRCGSYGKAQMLLQPNLTEPYRQYIALEAASITNAFKGTAYPYPGPCPCPSTVPCDAIPCSSAVECGSGVCFQTCIGGVNDGVPCRFGEHCPGGTCGNGFCRDACGRCTD
jgi:hypothetical protein